jgi:hypothetical protein
MRSTGINKHVVIIFFSRAVGMNIYAVLLEG